MQPVLELDNGPTPGVDGIFNESHPDRRYRGPSRLTVPFRCMYVFAAVLTACSQEARPIGMAVPLSAPRGADDPRIAQYQQNYAQVSQGARYYLWYGCTACHGAANPRGPDLALGRWRGGSGFDAVYAAISRGQEGEAHDYGGRIPVEQLWQLTAYVRELPQLESQKRRRQDVDTSAEPQAGSEPPS